MARRTKTATFIRDITGWRGEAKLFKLDPPLREDGADHTFVIVSALRFAPDHGGPETLMFPASPDGEVASWLDLHGSERGTTEHHRVLMNAGYEVTT